MWQVTGDRWQWHVTRDTWNITHDTWCGVNILSKFQLSSSNGLGFMMLWISGGKGSLTQWINHEAVCRTAPATPGRLIIHILWIGGGGPRMWIREAIPRKNLLRFGHCLNPNCLRYLFLLWPKSKNFWGTFLLKIWNNEFFFFSIFSGQKKVPRWCPRTQGGGQSDFDNVQIESDLFSGLLP